MKPEYCHLERRKGNWVTVMADGKARPSTKTELYLWQQMLRLRTEAANNLRAAALIVEAR